MTEHEPLFAYGIFKVIYSPFKAFKEIIEKPKYAGPFLLLILFILANVAFGYMYSTKTYIDQTIPHSEELDKWTEDTAFWIANNNTNITANQQDYIGGRYYGNESIQFSSAASFQIWAQLNVSDSVNCSGSEGYKNLTFRVKLIEPLSAPSNVSLYLFSGNLQSSFYQDMTNELNVTDIWNNETISVGDTSQGWTASDTSADWSNITGLKLEFTWPTESNITVLIDGLFFHGLYEPLIEFASSELISYPLNAFVQFPIQWVVLGGVLYIVPRMFKAKTVWKPLLIASGYALITLLIQMIVMALVFFAYPEIYLPFSYVGGVTGEWETTYLQALGPLLTAFEYIERIMYVWTIALCAIPVRFIFEFSWPKSIFVAALSYILSLFIFRFLTYGTIWL
jgi:hypothetical protein